MLPHNLATYLDEAGDDPLLACGVVAGHGFRTIALRRLWTAWPHAVSDQACQRLLGALTKHKLGVATVVSGCGHVPPADLPSERQKLERALLVASYFRAGSVVIGGGIGEPTAGHVDDWLTYACGLLQTNSLRPILELTPDSPFRTPDQLQDLLNRHSSLRLQYDPVQLLARRRLDPTTYWTTLLRQISHVDLHDIQVGQSVRPLGHGDCSWDRIKADLLARGSPGRWSAPGWWMFLEPGLGRHYGNAASRAQTFAFGLDAFRTFWRQ